MKGGSTQSGESPSSPAGEEFTITIDDMPWDSDVGDDDWCQPVKKKKMGGVIVLCNGKCPKKRPKCVLQKRKSGSTMDWKDVPDSMEAGDKKYEYRCICR